MLSRTDTQTVMEDNLIKYAALLALLLVILYWSAARAQHPGLDAVANKVIQKYQQTSCEDLAKQKEQPKSPKEQEAMKLLRSDPQARTAFINKVAGPIVNKMFDCGMIP